MTLKCRIRDNVCPLHCFQVQRLGMSNPAPNTAEQAPAAVDQSNTSTAANEETPIIIQTPAVDVQVVNAEDNNNDVKDVTGNTTTTTVKARRKTRNRKDELNTDVDGGKYSDDFESGSDCSDDDAGSVNDAIDMVREATFRYNQIEFERKLRALSAESNLPEVDINAHAQCLSARKDSISARQTEHDNWLDSFRQKKERILERLGVVLKSRSERFHEVCDIVLTPRTQKGTGGKPPPAPPKDWPEVVDLGEQLRQ